MGMLLIDKAADYSARAIGHAGLYTSVSTGLESLHELRRSASKAINNAAPNKAQGAVIGAPTFSPASMNMTFANAVRLGSRPANGGLTVATIVKMKTGGATNDGVVGTPVDAVTSVGAAWITLYNRRLSFSAYSYAAGSTPPLSGYTIVAAYLDFTAPSDGLYEMFFGVLENGVSIRVYHPKSGNLFTTATARDFAFDSPALFQTCTTPVTPGTTAQDEAMFGHWSRVLTPTEMNTVYGEMQLQFARLSLAI
jgi:hypothetical protein